METVHKLSIGWINQDPGSRDISQSVLDCSRSYQASRSKGNRIALPSTQVVCGLTMLRGTRHKPKTCFVLSGQVCLQNTATTSLRNYYGLGNMDQIIEFT